MYTSCRLDARSRKLQYQLSRLRGSKLTQFMDRSYHLVIYRGETVSVRPILQEVEELREELVAATVELSIQQEEINSMRSKMNELLKERDSFINFGQVVEHVGVRQQCRKISHFKDATEAALWFAESFGLIPESITAHTIHSQDQLTISLGQDTEVNSAKIQKPSVREVDEFVALQTLYLLDRFGVSDECYHEMTQVIKTIQNV